MTEQTATGRVNIALTGPADIARDAIEEKFPTREKQQLVRLGLAYAIRLRLEPERGETFGRAGDGQNMHVGSFDPSGEIGSLIEAIYPGSRDPYDTAEVLMSLGLVRLAEDIRDGKVNRLSDITYGRESD